MKKEDFDITHAEELFYESLLDLDVDNAKANSENEAAYRKQKNAIKYAEEFARLGNNEAKKFIIIIAQGKEGTLGEFALATTKRDAFNSVQYFFGNFVKTQCINKFKATNPIATYDELNEDVNGAVNSAWIEITNDFQSYNPNIAEFSTWARGRILGGIQNYLAEKRGRKSKTTLQTDKHVHNMEEELKSEGILTPSATLIAQRLGISVETVKNSLTRMEAENKALSIESMYTNSDQDGYKELNLINTMNPISEDLFSPEKRMAIQEQRQILVNALSLLTEQEKMIVSLYQNIIIDEDGLSSALEENQFSIKEISEMMNLPENKVIHMYSNALKKLKNYIERENSEELGIRVKEKDNFLSNRTMTFSKSPEDEDLIQIINSIEDITD